MGPDLDVASLVRRRVSLRFPCSYWQSILRKTKLDEVTASRRGQLRPSPAVARRIISIFSQYRRRRRRHYPRTNWPNWPRCEQCRSYVLFVHRY